MQIKTISVGPLETNCYLVSQGETNILIDPGDDAEKILREIGDKKIDYIILTHLHFDHIGAVSEVKKVTKAKVLCSEKDLEILDENLLGKNEIDESFGRDTLQCVSTIKTISTPGHSAGSICLYFPVRAHCNVPLLFSGDTIFRGSVGVTHFKGGDFDALRKSISEKLFTLPDNTHVYPGHGEDFILGEYKDEIQNILQ